MPSSRTRESERVSRDSKAREGKPLSFDQHVERLKRTEPHLLKADGFDAYIVAQALLENGALDHDNIKLQTAEYMLARLASRYVTDFHASPERRTPRAPVMEAPEIGSTVKRLLVLVINGKRFVDYTIGEAKELSSDLAALIASFPKTARDDELVGKYLK